MGTSLSLMEPEPVNPVTFNGVEFKVNDPKGVDYLVVRLRA